MWRITLGFEIVRVVAIVWGQFVRIGLVPALIVTFFHCGRASRRTGHIRDSYRERLQ